MARPSQQPSRPACSCSQPAAQQAAVAAERPKHSACFQVSFAYCPACLRLDPFACYSSLNPGTLDAHGKGGRVYTCNPIIECGSCQMLLLELTSLLEKQHVNDMSMHVDILHACAAHWECSLCYLLHVRPTGIAHSSCYQSCRFPHPNDNSYDQHNSDIKRQRQMHYQGLGSNWMCYTLPYALMILQNGVGYSAEIASPD